MASGELDQHRHRGLVVGAENRLAAAPVDAVLLDHFDPALVGDGVQVTEEREPALAPSRDPRDQVPGPGPGSAGGAVLARLHSELSQLREDGVGDRPLLPCGAGDLAEADEAVEQSLVGGLHEREAYDEQPGGVVRDPHGRSASEAAPPLHSLWLRWSQRPSGECHPSRTRSG
jgi:hypothetical protein